VLPAKRVTAYCLEQHITRGLARDGQYGLRINTHITVTTVTTVTTTISYNQNHQNHQNPPNPPIRLIRNGSFLSRILTSSIDYGFL
jgi:hypothetical protein